MSEFHRKISRFKAGRIVQFVSIKIIFFLNDDESYFNLNNTILARIDRFYSSNIYLTERSIKNKEVTKFDKKNFSLDCNISKRHDYTFFLSSGLAINQYVYATECISKRQIY